MENEAKTLRIWGRGDVVRSLREELLADATVGSSLSVGEATERAPDPLAREPLRQGPWLEIVIGVAGSAVYDLLKHLVERALRKGLQTDDADEALAADGDDAPEAQTGTPTTDSDPE